MSCLSQLFCSGFVFRENPIMLKLFKSKSELERLSAEREKMLKKAFDLSKTNRKESDRLYAEADALARKIEEREGK
jgi:hypothetical protein